MLNGVSISVSGDDDDEVPGKMRVRSRHKRRKPASRGQRELLRRAVRTAMRWWPMILFLPTIVLLLFESSRIGRKPDNQNRPDPVGFAKELTPWNLNHLDPTTRVVNGKRERVYGATKFVQHSYILNIVDSKSQFRWDPIGILEALLWHTNSILALSEHGAHSSLYDGAKAVVRKHKATPEEVEIQIKQYRLDGISDDKRLNGKKGTDTIKESNQDDGVSQNNNFPEFPNKDINRRIAWTSTAATVGLYLSRRLDFGVSLKDVAAASTPYEEHRYYGKPMPYGSKEDACENADSLSYLTTEQALADFSVLLTDLKRNLSSEDSPVVLFGGSYGGMLAAWMRLKYPRFNLFTGYQTLREREESYKVNESVELHCCFYSENGGFQSSKDDKEYMQTCKVVVSRCALGGGDDLYQPIGMTEASLMKVCYVAFWDEITLSSQEKGGKVIGDDHKIGKWRIVVVKDLPFSDQRLMVKYPSHLLFPNGRFSIWVDSKSQFRRDPIGTLEALLWRTNSVLALSEHGAHGSLYDEAKAVVRKNKATPEEVEIQIKQYRLDGIPDDKRLNGKKALAEASIILREHTPSTNIFMCLWFNEVVRFTSRDQLSFPYVLRRLRMHGIYLFPVCVRKDLVNSMGHMRKVKPLAKETS